jgi:transcriptional regulator with XRE-family HTH domain
MDEGISHRLREIRCWRQLTLRAAAELAGITYGYLGQIERGEKPVNNRRVLEALANALRVSPTELTRTPLSTDRPCWL